GDAINMTMEAIRRVAPQLALLQQQASVYGTQQGFGTGIGFGAPPWVQQAQVPWQPQYGQQLYPQPQSIGLPFFGGGQGGQIDPITAAYLHGHIQVVRSVLAQSGLGGYGQQASGPRGGVAGPATFGRVQSALRTAGTAVRARATSVLGARPR